MGDHCEVSLDMQASPEAVYALVSDLPRMGRWSPECVRCDWRRGATAAVPGARFKGRNRIGVRRWSTNGEVVTAVPGQELTFDISSVFGLPVSRWTYRITPNGDSGCTVTERWDDRRGALMNVASKLVSGIDDRAAHNTEGMRRTLERIKAEVEG